MAINTQKISPTQQARRRRIELARYLNLDGSRYLFGVVLLLCLMSLISLAQTGVVATKGYALANLEAHKIELLRERSQLELRRADAHSLDRVRLRARELGMQPISEDQVQYLTIKPLAAPELLEPTAMPVVPKDPALADPAVPAPPTAE
jgi:hypothetical protein